MSFHNITWTTYKCHLLLVKLCNHYYLQHALLLIILFLLLYIYNFICSLVRLNCYCSAVFESWFMDNHDSCKFNESLINNMLCLLHFLVSPPQKWGGRNAGEKWGDAEIFFFASIAKIYRLSKSDLRPWVSPNKTFFMDRTIDQSRIDHFNSLK